MKTFGNPILAGLLAGAVAGVLYASLATGSAFGLLLFYLAPLPAFIAGFGWGIASALISLLAGSLLSLVLIGPLGGLTFACGVALPAVVLTHYAFLYRQPGSEAAPDTTEASEIEWYPAGNLLLSLSLMAGTLAVAIIVILGPSYETYAATVSQEVGDLVKKALAAGIFKPMSSEEIAHYRQMVITLLPAATAMMWLFIALLNAWGAGHVVRISGQLRRPWPDLSALYLSKAVPVAFLTLVGASMLFDGSVELFFSGYAAALAIALLTLGLAVAHHISRGHPMRGLFLFATYAGAFLVGWGAFLLILIGLLDPFLDFRRIGAAKRP